MYSDEIMMPHSLWLDNENGEPIGYIPGRRMGKQLFLSPYQYVEASLVAQLVKNPSWIGKISWIRDRLPTPVFMGFPGSSDGKESACNGGDLDLIPGLGRSPGGGHGNPLQYSCLENPYGQRSLAGYSLWVRKESCTTEQLSTAQHMWFKKAHQWPLSFLLWLLMLLPAKPYLCLLCAIFYSPYQSCETVTLIR